MWNPFKKKEPEAEVIDMTPGEKGIIRMYANDDHSVYNAAIELHRKYIPLIGARSTDEQRFMSEVDTVCPDYALRAHYREILLDK